MASMTLLDGIDDEAADGLKFTAAPASIRKLLEDARLTKFLTANYPDMIWNFRRLELVARWHD